MVFALFVCAKLVRVRGASWGGMRPSPYLACLTVLPSCRTARNFQAKKASAFRETSLRRSGAQRWLLGRKSRVALQRLQGRVHCNVLPPRPSVTLCSALLLTARSCACWLCRRRADDLDAALRGRDTSFEVQLSSK